MSKVDVIIPTYKPSKKLVKIIERLENQTYAVNRIILINTEKCYFDDFFEKEDVLNKYSNISVAHITKDEFDHGKTRKMGVSMSDADYFVCMTDDAVPVDNGLIEALIRPLEEKNASVSYARQCVPKKAPVLERYTRRFNYPKESSVKSLNDLERLGIKTYFCSDVCAMYDRKIYESLGGFTDRAIFNEDMIMASKFIKAGYRICYSGDAKVMHYHNYTCMQQLRRNFDLGVSHAENPDVFKDVPPAKEGVKMVKSTMKYLKKKHLYFDIFTLIVNSGFKYVGFRLGKMYRVLPKGLVKWLSMNKNYWK